LTSWAACFSSRLLTSLYIDPDTTKYAATAMRATATPTELAASRVTRWRSESGVDPTFARATGTTESRAARIRPLEPCGGAALRPPLPPYVAGDRCRPREHCRAAGRRTPPP